MSLLSGDPTDHYASVETLQRASEERAAQRVREEPQDTIEERAPTAPYPELLKLTIGRDSFAAALAGVLGATEPKRCRALPILSHALLAWTPEGALRVTMTDLDTFSTWTVPPSRAFGSYVHEGVRLEEALDGDLQNVPQAVADAWMALVPAKELARALDFYPRGSRVALAFASSLKHETFHERRMTSEGKTYTHTLNVTSLLYRVTLTAAPATLAHQPVGPEGMREEFDVTFAAADFPTYHWEQDAPLTSSSHATACLRGELGVIWAGERARSFLDGVRALAEVAAKGEARPVFNAVCIAPGAGGADPGSVTLVAADSFRLGIFTPQLCETAADGRTLAPLVYGASEEPQVVGKLQTVRSAELQVVEGEGGVKEERAVAVESEVPTPPPNDAYALIPASAFARALATLDLNHDIGWRLSSRAVELYQHDRQGNLRVRIGLERMDGTAHYPRWQYIARDFLAPYAYLLRTEASALLEVLARVKGAPTVTLSFPEEGASALTVEATLEGDRMGQTYTVRAERPLLAYVARVNPDAPDGVEPRSSAPARVAASASEEGSEEGGDADAPMRVRMHFNPAFLRAALKALLKQTPRPRGEKGLDVCLRLSINSAGGAAQATVWASPSEELTELQRGLVVMDAAEKARALWEEEPRTQAFREGREEADARLYFAIMPMHDNLNRVRGRR